MLRGLEDAGLWPEVARWSYRPGLTSRGAPGEGGHPVFILSSYCSGFGLATAPGGWGNLAWILTALQGEMETVSLAVGMTMMVSITSSPIKGFLAPSLIISSPWRPGRSSISQGLDQKERLTMASRYSLLFSLRLVS